MNHIPNTFWQYALALGKHNPWGAFFLVGVGIFFVLAVSEFDPTRVRATTKRSHHDDH